MSAPYLKALFSPFKPLRFKFYVGKTAIGTPHFLPRKWVPLTTKEIEQRVAEQVARAKSRGVDVNSEELMTRFSRATKPVPRRFGIDLVGLGWKTKWNETDIRFEWSPIWSLVIGKWQLAITVIPSVESIAIDHYWEAWLLWEYHTDKSLSRRQRIEQCRSIDPMKSTVWRQGQEPEEIDWWTRILKEKYL